MCTSVVGTTVVGKTVVGTTVVGTTVVGTTVMGTTVMGTTDEQLSWAQLTKKELKWAVYPFVMTHQLLCKKQNPTSNAGAKELGFGTVGGATLVIIKEIIEITEGKKEEKKEEGVLEKVMTSKK